MKRKNMAKIMLAASAVTGATAMAQEKVEATELNNEDNYVDTVDNQNYLQRGQVINAPHSLRVRSDASTNSSILGYLSNGSSVSIIAEKGDWYRISFNGGEGYVHGDYIKIVGTTSNTVQRTSEKGQVINITTALNIRQSPNTTSAVLGTLKNGATFDIVGRSGDFYHIKTSYLSGYVHGDYVKVLSSSSSDTNTNDNVTTSSSQKGKVVNITSALNVRQYANTSSAVIKTLKNGETFDIISKSGSWYNIKTGSTIGFVHGDYVQVISNTSSNPSTGDTTISTISGKVVNVTSNLRVRTGPGTNYNTLGYLLNGQSVSITGENGDWYKIDYNGKVGYVHKDYIQKSSSGSGSNSTVVPETPSTPEVTTRYGQVINITSNLRVRSGASTNHSVLGYLLNGQRVTITGETGNWYQIDYNGTKGYVSSDYIRIVNQNESSDYMQVFNSVYNAMKAHVGSPYVWGGTGEMLTSNLLNTLKNRYPNETARGMYARAEAYADQGYRAFDCSGLMQWGFAQVGINLGRSTWHQIENGYEVSLDDIRPGDLLFYSNLQHVGMYIGNGQWIEAPNQNANVRVVNVPWSNIGRARRVIN